jgi:hypothetical protein
MLQLRLQSPRAGLYRSLLVHWADAIAKDERGSQSAEALQLALKFDLRETGVQLARDVLAESGSAANALRNAAGKPYAAIVLARFGDSHDAKFLVPHLDDARVFHTWSNPQLQQEPIRIQVRDVMLAMLLRMRKRDPAQCGFELLDPFPETLYRIWTFGFLRQQDREDVFARWRQLAIGEDL